MTSSVHQFKVRNIDGETVSLAQYQGKVLVIVNVASRWGKTDVNYRQLVELTEKYPQLRVLAFPCNQFGGQEPGTDQEIKNFATNKYNAKVRKLRRLELHHSAKILFQFDLFSKIDVNGSNADPLFAFLKEKQAGFLLNAIKWNFTKFIIDKDGVPVCRLGPMDDPIPAVEKEIKKYFWKSKL